MAAEAETFVPMGMEPEDLANISEEDLEVLAHAAETGERYEDMCKFMTHIIEKVTKLHKKEITDDVPMKDRKYTNHPTTDQRNMLSVAFKNVVGAKRQSMRNLKEETQSEGKKVKTDEDKSLQKHRKAYLKMVESEVIHVCNQVLKVVISGPLTLNQENEDPNESTVFWLKMCGDYCRYLSEIDDNDEAKVLVASGSTDAEKSSKPDKRAEEFYKQAMEAAEEALPETHPTRLGLALNYSVCYYEILDKKEEACKLAKKAFDAAIEKLDTLNDKSYKDSTLIMQLLRDNLTLWTQTNEEVEQA